MNRYFYSPIKADFFLHTIKRENLITNICRDGGEGKNTFHILNIVENPIGTIWFFVVVAFLLLLSGEFPTIFAIGGFRKENSFSKNINDLWTKCLRKNSANSLKMHNFLNTLGQNVNRCPKIIIFEKSNPVTKNRQKLWIMPQIFRQIAKNSVNLKWKIFSDKIRNFLWPQIQTNVLAFGAKIEIWTQLNFQFWIFGLKKEFCLSVKSGGEKFDSRSVIRTLMTLENHRAHGFWPVFKFSLHQALKSIKDIFEMFCLQVIAYKWACFSRTHTKSRNLFKVKLDFYKSDIPTVFCWIFSKFESSNSGIGTRKKVIKIDVS